MLLDFPEMANMLNMSEYVPDEYSEMSLRNFFLSNYQDDVLASSFHGAINYNWFFQCRGNKRWWVVDRDLISYLGVFVHSIILLPSVRDEKLLRNHLPLYMADTNEGDMLFTPAFWMHAVRLALVFLWPLLIGSLCTSRHCLLTPTTTYLLAFNFLLWLQGLSHKEHARAFLTHCLL